MIALAIFAQLITMSRMPNQRDIAAKIGLNQATVSLALRGHPSIPLKTRQLVNQAAAQLGYRPNSYISSLMSHIRAGRPLQDKGCLAILVDARSKDEWLTMVPYQKYLSGLTHRAEQLGFHAECFFLRASGMSSHRIDHILHARGINGLIIAPPWLPTSEPIEMHWERYALVATGYSWKKPDIDRVANDQYKNVVLAYRELVKRGYRKIAMSLPQNRSDTILSRWLGGYTQCEQEFCGGPQIPVFFGTPDDTPLAKFRTWLKKWKPDALITLVAHEAKWLRQLPLEIPKELAVACVVHSLESTFSGIMENNELVGKTTADIVSSLIFGNEYGLPTYPKLVLIEGQWVEGHSVLPHAPKVKPKLFR